MIRKIIEQHEKHENCISTLEGIVYFYRKLIMYEDYLDDLGTLSSSLYEFYIGKCVLYRKCIDRLEVRYLKQLKNLEQISI